MFKTAIIGLGDISKVHIPIVKAMPFTELAAVCDINKQCSNNVANVPFYESAEVLLKETKPDVVHICLPHNLHYSMAVLAAKSGAHIFCEKPLALNYKEAIDFANLERAYPDLHFGLCLQNRYNKSVVELLKIIKIKNLGEVKSIKAIVAWCRGKEYFDASPWRGTMAEAGGGAMINQSIHTLDLMQAIAGDIESISGQTSRLLSLGVDIEDTASAVINFKNGARGMFFATITNAKNTNVEIEVSFENASYIIRDNCLLEQVDGGYNLICEDDKLAGTKFYYGASHQVAISNFYESIIEKSENYIMAKEGLMSLKMIAAINESSKIGAPVKFN